MVEWAIHHGSGVNINDDAEDDADEAKRPKMLVKCEKFHRTGGYCRSVTSTATRSKSDILIINNGVRAEERNADAREKNSLPIFPLYNDGLNTQQRRRRRRGLNVSVVCQGSNK